MLLLDRFLRRLITRGTLTVIEANGREHLYGAPDPTLPSPTLRFHDRRAPNRVATHPRLGFAEAFMDGRFTVENGDIRDVINLARANAPWEEAGDAFRDGGLVALLDGLARRFDRLNGRFRARRNVAHHYDLDDRLYRLFLDVDRQYSCAYFATPDLTLEAAQHAKLAHIAAKLQLRPGQRVLDIGCGWGGMALFLNRVADVEVLGVTLSEEQLKIARERAVAAGVADRVHFALVDYRDVAGRFDRIVSIGMFEHVGPPSYPTFFRKCRELLAEDGVMLLHTIGLLGGPGQTDAFTRKYIFPGGYVPALSETLAASEQVRLIAADVETLRLHYAWTLDAWYDRTVAARAEIERLYDARFYRMWTFYLAGAAAAFRDGEMCNYQIQYVRRRDALPVTRDYMRKAEEVLRRA